MSSHQVNTCCLVMKPTKAVTAPVQITSGSERSLPYSESSFAIGNLLLRLSMIMRTSTQTMAIADTKAMAFSPLKKARRYIIIKRPAKESAIVSRIFSLYTLAILAETRRSAIITIQNITLFHLL